ncbi:bone morphogenetic protein 7-like [Centruroides sculpturatus]|uniref:bone morphogenetic protein 7-like n=1 Tax=Centruroides sculpturatus TaxID=218467 RepID=UPI000C6DAF54|nr:bone morphogenetic protein 7-like [Centruroides sculpturatus]
MIHLTLALILLWRAMVIRAFPSFDMDRERELNILKEKILTDLGLSRLPDMNKVNITKEQIEKMKLAYERSVKESEQEERIRKVEDPQQHFYSFKDNASKINFTNKYHLFFPMNFRGQSAIKGASLHSAKLYIYKHKVPWYQLSTTATVKLYQVMKPYNKYSAETILLEIRNVVFDVDGWEVFDISESVSTWLEKPSRNFGLEVECEDCQDRNKILIMADTVTKEDTDKRSYLDMWITESPSRSKRSKALENKFQSSVLDCTEGHKTDLCCKHSMWVSFAEIGWEWIMKPAGFEAFYCKGRCPHDYNNYASTHALIQSIFNYHRSQDIPAPCCVPKRLKPLNLLHFNDKDPPELIITKQMGMIVQECACS